MEAKLIQLGGILQPYWQIYDTPLADLLHPLRRIDTRRWPTYYIPLADLLHPVGRLVTCTLNTRTGAFRRRPRLGRLVAHLGRLIAHLDRPVSFRGWIITHLGRLITRGGQAGVRRAADGRRTGARLGRGLDTCLLG